MRGIAGHIEQAEKGAIRKSPQAHKHFCPLLPTAMVFVSYGFVLVQVQVLNMPLFSQPGARFVIFILPMFIIIRIGRYLNSKATTIPAYPLNEVIGRLGGGHWQAAVLARHWLPPTSHQPPTRHQAAFSFKNIWDIPSKYLYFYSPCGLPPLPHCPMYAGLLKRILCFHTSKLFWSPKRQALADC
jgi:hypothetical protein